MAAMGHLTVRVVVHTYVSTVGGVVSRERDVGLWASIHVLNAVLPLVVWLLGRRSFQPSIVVSVLIGRCTVVVRVMLRERGSDRLSLVPGIAANRLLADGRSWVMNSQFGGVSDATIEVLHFQKKAHLLSFK